MSSTDRGDIESIAVIVVVTHRGPSGPITECLRSLDAAEQPSQWSQRIVVVDNGVDTRLDHPVASDYGIGCFTAITSPNHGYGAALDTGFAAARANIEAGCVLIGLNDDLVVDPGWLAPLLTALDNDHGLGAVQPLLIDASSGLIGSAGVKLGRDGAGNDIGRGEPVESATSGPIDIFTGGAVALRSAFIDDVGGFDERYFLYYEDVDLALRGAERGWRYRCVTESLVRHHGGVSTTSLGSDLARLHERNRLWTSIRFGDVPTMWRSLWLALRRLRHHPRKAHAAGMAQAIAVLPRLVRARRRGQGAS